jgi:hypothetical protein
VVDAGTAFERSLGRSRQNPLRAAHADPGPDDAAERALAHERFQRVALNVPSLEVDTTDGYRPGLGEIAGFVTGRARCYSAGRTAPAAGLVISSSLAQPRRPADAVH